MVDLLVTGSTNPTSANGVYKESGTYGGNTNYSNGSYQLFYDDGKWIIGTAEVTILFYREDLNFLGAYSSQSGTGSVTVIEYIPPTYTIKQAMLKTNYPITDGIIAETTTQTGHVMQLEPEFSLVADKYKKGL